MNKSLFLFALGLLAQTQAATINRCYGGYGFPRSGDCMKAFSSLITRTSGVTTDQHTWIPAGRSHVGYWGACQASIEILPGGSPNGQRHNMEYLMASFDKASRGCHYGTFEWDDAHVLGFWQDRLSIGSRNSKPGDNIAADSFKNTTESPGFLSAQVKKLEPISVQIIDEPHSDSPSPAKRAPGNAIPMKTKTRSDLSKRDWYGQEVYRFANATGTFYRLYRATQVQEGAFVPGTLDT